MEGMSRKRGNMNYYNITLTKEQIVRFYDILYTKASKQIVSDEEYEILDTLSKCMERNNWKLVD